MRLIRFRSSPIRFIFAWLCRLESIEGSSIWFTDKGYVVVPGPGAATPPPPTGPNSIVKDVTTVYSSVMKPRLDLSTIATHEFSSVAWS